jgi:hypothetical protein
MDTTFQDQAFARGFRDGLRSIVTGRCEVPHRILRRQVGSPATDRLARHRDMDTFGADVCRGKRDVIRA